VKQAFLLIEQEAIAWLAIMAFAGDSDGLRHLLMYFTGTDSR
jgi:hypothetical protein